MQKINVDKLLRYFDHDVHHVTTVFMGSIIPADCYYTPQGVSIKKIIRIFLKRDRSITDAILWLCRTSLREWRDSSGERINDIKSYADKSAYNMNKEGEDKREYDKRIKITDDGSNWYGDNVREIGADGQIITDISDYR